MALTLESVNEGRKAMGLEPLTKLATDTTATAPATEKKPDEKLTDTNTPNDIPDLSDDKVLEFLKSKGITVSSFEDLKPKVVADSGKTPEEIAEERENKKLSYALENKLFNTKDHEGFITDSKNKETLVFAEYVKEARKEEPELTDDDLQEEFTAKYGLNNPVDSRKHKRGLVEIEMLADKILKTRYGKIYDADNKFSTYENQQKEESAFQTTLREKSPVYTKDVNEVFEGLKKIPVKVSDTETSEIDVTEDTLTKVKEHFLKASTIADNVKNGWTKDQLKEIAFMSVLKMDYTNIINKEANARMLKNQGGTRGIPAGGTAVLVDTSNPKNLTENQKKALAMYKPEPVAN